VYTLLDIYHGGVLLLLLYALDYRSSTMAAKSESDRRMGEERSANGRCGRTAVACYEQEIGC